MLILTPNRRLSSFSQRAYQNEQAALHKECWVTQEIYPIEVWLRELWQLCLEHDPTIFRPLISATQQQYLIEQIIQNSDTANALLRVNATAQNVIEAWKFMMQWQFNVADLAAYASFSPDVAAFYAWITEYIQWLNEHDLYDFYLMVNELNKHVPLLLKMIPKQICLRGFSELIPQYAVLFKTMQDCGVEIIHDQLLSPGATCTRIGLKDCASELQAAADWAQQLLQRDPEQTIGIVVPELTQMRTQVANIFHSTLSKDVVNISAPLPIMDYSLISAGILILQMGREYINFSDLSILLRCPFVGNFGREANLRAQIDRHLREHVEARLSWQQLQQSLSTFNTDFNERISKFVLKFSDLQGNHHATYWATQFNELLSVWGWPGDSIHNATEADLLSCWRDLLTTYCGLSGLLQKHSYNQSLQMIQRLATETPFLPAETGLTKVHVLGVLEADGILFDNLWVCGMMRDSWPPAANPNPFIPIELQREYDLPHSSPQRELAVAKRLTVNLQQGARHNVVFSYPEFVDDHKMAPSNLIAGIPIEVIPATTLCSVIPAKRSASVDLDPGSRASHLPGMTNQKYHLETWHDNKAPPITDARLPGGTSALSLQERCPFKANAEIRLQAKQLKEPQLILTALDRGNIIHAVLELFWQECKTHAQLLAWIPDTLESELTNCIKRVLAAWHTKRPLTLTASYMAIEEQCLLAMLTRWLYYEAKRTSFAVSKLEQQLVVQIGGLQLRLQVDRIDQLPDNSFAIIDYKTGNKAQSRWDPPAVLDPQLPAYAVYAVDNVSAIALAIVRPSKSKFVGLADSDVELLDVAQSDDWYTRKSAWKASLENTVTKIAAGEAQVQPYSSHECKVCKLQSMCRIYDY